MNQEEEPLLQPRTQPAANNAQDTRLAQAPGQYRQASGTQPTTPPLMGPSKTQAATRQGRKTAAPQSVPASVAALRPKTKQPNRTTKTSQKLVVFPDAVQPEAQVTDVASEFGDGDDDRVVSYPFQVAKEKEAERLKRVDRKVLPRVTAYCTAKAYHIDSLYTFLLSKRDSNGCDPQRIDECVYTRYVPPVNIFQFVPPNPSNMPGGTSSSSSRSMKPPRTPPPPVAKKPDSLSSTKRSPKTDWHSVPVPDAANGHILSVDVDEHEHRGTEPATTSANDVAAKAWEPPQGELFIFDYGVVVIWGLTEPQEYYVLSQLKPFEEEKLEPDEIETEAFHYQYRVLSQPRIFNDVITLRAIISSQVGASGFDEDHLQKQDSMIKLTISHAIAQSTKLTLFEQRIDDTIITTQHIPLIMAKTGKVPMSRSAITKKIGQLFVMRINVNLVSPILDTPEIFWSEPSLEPLYSAVRGYLEISQRVELLNQRCNVISDLLDMLKEHLNSAHGETLEWIIIILIAIEILIGLVEIFFDFFNYYNNVPPST